MKYTKLIPVRPLSNFYKSLIKANASRFVWMTFVNSDKLYIVRKVKGYTVRDMANYLAHLHIQYAPVLGKPKIRLCDKKQHKRMVENRVF